METLIKNKAYIEMSLKILTSLETGKEYGVEKAKLAFIKADLIDIYNSIQEAMTPKEC